MTSLTGLYEAHLPVSDHEAALAFYRDRLELELGRIDPERGSIFLWLGEGVERGMLGLHECEVRRRAHAADRHVSFRFDGHPDEMVDWLKQRGVDPLDNAGEPAREPVVFAWMPAASVFFQDPDGNLLELIVDLDDQPRPELGVVPWSRWASDP